MYWEFRRILLSQGLSRVRLDTHKVVQSEFLAWARLWALFGLQAVDCFKHSRFSCRLRCVATENFSRDEHCITTVGMLLYLLHQGAHRRRRAERDKVFSVFQGGGGGGLRNLVSDGRAADLLAMGPPAHDVGACRVGVDGEGDDPCFCLHVRQFMESFRPSPVNSHQSQLASFLVELFARSSLCDVVRAWASVGLKSASAAVDEGLRGIDMPSDPLKHGFLQTGQRGIRIDEDYKRAVAERVVCEGRAASSSAFLCSQGDLTPTMGAKVEARWPTEYQLESRARLTSSRTVGVELRGLPNRRAGGRLVLVLGVQPGHWQQLLVATPGGAGDSRGRGGPGFYRGRCIQSPNSK